jgi:hypothetical protein
LNLLKTFQNRRDSHWPAFKSGGRYAASFSKAIYLPDFKTGEIAHAGFQKLSAQLQDICCPIVAKDLNSPVLKSSQQIQKFLVLNSSELINSV